jgi:hypothetical protein
MTQTTAASFQKRYQSIPQHLKISIVYQDENIVVINKPNNLRSVPGKAEVIGQKRPRQENRTTPQEAWISALHSFAMDQCDEGDNVRQMVANLTNSTSSFSSIPRKWNAFHRYVERNQYRLLGFLGCNNAGTKRSGLKQGQLNKNEIETVARQAYETIVCRQLPLLNLPESTQLEDSAFGQLVLLGYAGESGSTNLHIVHRLDCEVSSIQDQNQFCVQSLFYFL